MTMKWRIAIGVLAAAGAWGADDPLCRLMPAGLSTSFQESPRGDLTELLSMVSKNCGGCNAGVGHVDDFRNMADGMSVRLVHYESEKGAQKAVQGGDQPTRATTREYGDMAYVTGNRQVAMIRFAVGSYYAEVYAAASYTPQVVAVARQLEQGLRQLPQQCGADSAAKIAAPPPPVRTPAAPAPTVQRRAETPGKAVACFREDPGAVSLDEGAHRSWALSQYPEAVKNNRAMKLQTIYSCRLMTEEQGKALFADLSLRVAGRFRDASCFGGDTGVLLRDRNAHLTAWKTGPAYYRNIQWKMGAAMNCLRTNQELATFFAETSVVIAMSLDEM